VHTRVVGAIALVTLFVLLPLGALAWGRSPRWDRPVPAAPVDVLDRWGRELRLTLLERRAVERAVRRGERAEDPRLRPVVAAVADATVSILDRPAGVRVARVQRVLFPSVSVGAVIFAIVVVALGHPGDAPLPVFYGLLLLVATVLSSRRRTAVRRARILNDDD
jgi:hypothetical protein